MSKPICYDGCCGLGGWSEGFLAEGYRCVGFDIEAHDYGTGGYPGELILRDMRQVHGSELKDAACLVFSPPCQEYSYMAMPWSGSKQIARALQGKDEFPEGYSGSRTVEQLNELFTTCFRIQREAIEAAGHYIPMVIENVRGAQKWVGRAKANYGSFYLWGDVGMVGRRVVAIREGKLIGVGIAPIRASKVPGFRFDGSGGSFQTAAVRQEGYKTAGMNWSYLALRGQDFTRIAGEQAEGIKADGSGWTEKGSLKSHNRLVANTGVKQAGISGPRNNGNGDAWFQDGAAQYGSKSNACKAASALIAKIPFALSQYIAQSFKPEEA